MPVIIELMHAVHAMLCHASQVSAMMKKHLVELVVPVIIELKRGMEAARHPLLGELMAATAAMLKDYKGEVGISVSAVNIRGDAACC